MTPSTQQQRGVSGELKWFLEAAFEPFSGETFDSSELKYRSHRGLGALGLTCLERVASVVSGSLGNDLVPIFLNLVVY